VTLRRTALFRRLFQLGSAPRDWNLAKTFFAHGLLQTPANTIQVSDGLINETDAAVPEPTSLAISGVALLGFLGIQRRRNRKLQHEF